MGNAQHKTEKYSTMRKFPIETREGTRVYVVEKRLPEGVCYTFPGFALLMQDRTGESHATFEISDGVAMRQSDHCKHRPRRILKEIYH